MKWPHKVFFDSTALYQLGSRLETVDLVKLLDMKDLEIEFLVPEASWREYLGQRRLELEPCIDRLMQIKKDGSKYGLELDELEGSAARIKDCLSRLDHNFTDKAIQLGLVILPIPQVNLSDLVQMSIDRTPPFEGNISDPKEKRKEKGFRDALIMFTVLEAIRGRPQDESLLITNDALLRSGCERLAAKYETTLSFAANVQDAINHIESRISQWYVKRLREQSEEAKEQLLKFREQITAKVEEIKELSEEDFGQGTVALLLGKTPENIERVISLLFKDVKAAIWKDRDQPGSRILFRITCEAGVVVSESSFSLYSPKKFLVGGGPVLRAFVGPGKQVEKTLNVELYGDAQLEKRDGEWQLVTLNIDRRFPAGEDFETLRLVERRPQN